MNARDFDDRVLRRKVRELFQPDIQGGHVRQFYRLCHQAPGGEGQKPVYEHGHENL